MKLTNQILCILGAAMQLSNRIRKARAKLNLSQSKAAEAWGIPKRTLISWENQQRAPRGLALVHLTQMLDRILGEGE